MPTGKSLAGEVWFNIIAHGLNATAVEDKGLVYMGEGQVYKIRFGNESSRRWNVYVSIDGEQIPGAFRLNAWGSWSLETIEGTGQQFIFRSISSAEGLAAGVNRINPANRGVVKLRFVPEVEEEFDLGSYGSRGGFSIPKGITTRGGGLACMGPSSSYSDRSGGTVMGGHSDQQFVSAERIDEDPANAVELQVRLVLKSPTPPKESTIKDTLANLPKQNTYFRTYDR